MPAMDTRGAKVGALHISDQNKLNPVKTLCGQALDKENVRYWINSENFDKADCKVCRSIYFDESWSGDTRSEPEQEPEPEGVVTPVVRNTLFNNLTKPVNEHKENSNGP